MFENERYMSRGVADRIGIEAQNLMWLMIEGMEVSAKDRFQVFTLSPCGEKQKITHIQEEPCYQKDFVYVCDKPVSEKIFVIDDGTHSTMILASEY